MHISISESCGLYSLQHLAKYQTMLLHALLSETCTFASPTTLIMMSIFNITSSRTISATKWHKVGSIVLMSLIVLRPERCPCFPLLAPIVCQYCRWRVSFRWIQPMGRDCNFRWRTWYWWGNRCTWETSTTRPSAFCFRRGSLFRFPWASSQTTTECHDWPYFDIVISLR